MRRLPDPLHTMLLANRYEHAAPYFYMQYYHAHVLLDALARHPTVRLVGRPSEPDAIVVTAPHLPMRSPLLAHLAAGNPPVLPPVLKRSDWADIWRNHFAHREGPLATLNQDGAAFHLSGMSIRSRRFIIWELARTVLPEFPILSARGGLGCLVMVSGGEHHLCEVVALPPAGQKKSHLPPMPPDRLPEELARLHQRLGALPFRR